MDTKKIAAPVLGFLLGAGALAGGQRLAHLPTVSAIRVDSVRFLPGNPKTSMRFAIDGAVVTDRARLFQVTCDPDGTKLDGVATDDAGLASACKAAATFYDAAQVGVSAVSALLNREQETKTSKK